MHSGTATLVVPVAGRFARIGENVWVAWNATRESARALHDAMPLLRRANDLGVDLVVMGGYGHSRMAEFLLGGVTRRLLAQMTTPVLLSH